MKGKILFITSLLVLGAIALSACGAIQPQASPAETPRTITVTGSKSIYITPDVAYISVGVHTEGASVAQAVNKNNNQVNQVIAAIKEMGIAEKDISTSNFSVYTRENYDMDGNRTADTYMVDNTVTLTVRNIDQLGDLLDVSVEAGANTIYGISFDLLDKGPALSEGRTAAVQDAATQAQELAAAGNLTLGEIQTINYYSSPYPMAVGGYGYGGAGFAAADKVSVSPGQMVIQVDVTVVYAIQ